MDINAIVNLSKSYGPGAALCILFGYVFFKTLEYITTQFKSQLTETTTAFMKSTEAQRDTHKSTLETMATAHKEVAGQTLEMMKMSQTYSQDMLKQISEHNLTVHRTLDSRMTNVETAVDKVQTGIEDLSRKMDIRYTEKTLPREVPVIVANSAKSEG